MLDNLCEAVMGVGIRTLIPTPYIMAKPNECHTNAARYISMNGGEQVLGYYVVDTDDGLLGILHSVVKSDFGYLDVTPNVPSTTFIELANALPYTRPMTVAYTDAFRIIQDVPFFVYALCDPRHELELGDELATIFTHLPFYIGKGKMHRPREHFAEAKRGVNNPKCTKIRKIWETGLEPIITHVKFFSDEASAYEYETKMITGIGSSYMIKLGIKDGPLTNICMGSNPPCLKGMTYVDIHGEEGAARLRSRTRDHQLEIGGYGPSNRTDGQRKKYQQL